MRELGLDKGSFGGRVPLRRSVDVPLWHWTALLLHVPDGTAVDHIDP